MTSDPVFLALIVMIAAGLAWLALVFLRAFFWFYLAGAAALVAALLA